MKIIKILQVFALLLLYVVASPSPPLHHHHHPSSMPLCGNAYGQQPCLYLPAKPGSKPPCASSQDSTFCENINDYPENLIKKLLKNYVSKDILTDELKTEFSAKKEATTTVKIPPYGPSFGYNYDHFNNGPQNYDGNFHGSAPSNNHFHNNNNFNYHHQQRGFNGYNYQRPKMSLSSSSSSFFQIKPSSTSNFNHPEMFRRTSREIHPFLNATEIEANQVTLFDRFLKVVQPRSKRQVSSNRETLCEVRSSYINPKAALSVKGNWMYIVNGAEATQLVRTETCVSSQCSNLCQLPNGYNSKCEQKYVQKRLVTLDPTGEKLFTDTFWFPSCCVCTLSNSIE